MTLVNQRKAIKHSYWAMVYRCTKTFHPYYRLYGGRGITVCERWLGDGGFKNFLADMSPRPAGTSLDRIDTDKGYEPSNCRWATAKQQGNNRSVNVVLNYRGSIATLGELSDLAGIDYQVMRWRINHGWSAAKAVETPVRPKAR